MILLLIAVVSLESLWFAGPGRPRDNFAAVESIDAHGRNVALLREDKTKTTVIWLYQEEGDETSEAPASPSF
jgi:hypothetical protein